MECGHPRSDRVDVAARGSATKKPIMAGRYLHWFHLPDSSKQTSRSSFSPNSTATSPPSSPTPPQVLSALAASGASSASPLDLAAPRPNSSAAGSVHSCPHDDCSPGAQPLIAGGTALVAPRKYFLPLNFFDFLRFDSPPAPSCSRWPFANRLLGR